MSCYFVNLWCCKLFMSVNDVPKSYFLKTLLKDMNRYTNTFQLPNMTLFGRNVYFVLYRQSDRPVFFKTCLFTIYFLALLLCLVLSFESPAWLTSL